MGAATSGLALILAAGLASEAEGEAPSQVALRPLQTTEALGEAQRNQLEDRVEAGLMRTGLDVRRTLPEDTQRCDTPACFKGMAKTLGADFVVVPTVDVALRACTFSFALIDGASGEVIGRSDETCRPCGLAEAADLAQALATQLRRRVDARLAQSAQIHVVSVPAGAAITIDDRPAGDAPVDIEVAAGRHIATAAIGEARRARLPFVATPGVAETIELRLPESMPTDRDRRVRVAGWAMVGVGAALTVTGSVLLGIHNQPVRTRCGGDNIDGAGNCRQLYNSLPYGIVSLSAGIALLGAGIALVASRRGKATGRRRTAFGRRLGLRL